MIFVDTSVWVEYLRGRNEALIARLNDLLDEDRVALAAPVRLELLLGASAAEQKRLGRLLSALPFFLPSHDAWPRMERWAEAAAKHGERFGMGDLLIGAICAENEGEIWSLDKDFLRMARLQFIRCASANHR